MKSKRSRAWHQRKEIARARAIIEQGLQTPRERMTLSQMELIVKQLHENMVATRERIAYKALTGLGSWPASKP